MARQSTEGPSSSTATSKIAALETKLLSTPYNPNPLVQLLNFARHPAPDVVHKAIWALHRLFIRYIKDGKVGGISDTALRRRSNSALEAEDDQTEGMEAREVRGWVRDRLLEYVEVLGGLLRDREPGLRKSALPLLFALLPPLSATVSDEPTIHIPYFRIILRSLLSPSPSLRGAKATETSEGSSRSSSAPIWAINEENQVDDEETVTPEDVLDAVQEEYWAKYDDLRWAFFREASRFLRSEDEPLKHGPNLLAQLLPLTNLPRVHADLNTFFIPSISTPPSSTSSIPTKKARVKKSKKVVEPESLPDWMATYDSDPSSDDEAGTKKRQRPSQLSIHASVHSIPSHQTLYSTLWETLLSSVEMDELWTRRVLLALHGKNGILSHMRPERRVRVSDWLGALVDQGGARAMLAMNGLFVLMTKFNLDYPNFYQRLYALLDPEVLHVKYRARFFRLLDTFLASPLLPSTLIASFIKRLSRLSLTAPPAGIIMVIPFIYNLFKRHPGCMVMIQRPPRGSEEEESSDPYKPDDPSPLTSNAIASSCWELVSLQNHYLASVSTLAKVFNEVFTKPEYNLEDFLDHGYGTLFETEIKRQIKRPPALSSALEGPQGLAGDPFPGKDAEDEVRAAGDIVSQLWSF